MITVHNGNLIMKKGERLPFVCPNCEQLIDYQEEAQQLCCVNCKFQGTAKEFSRGTFELVQLIGSA